ncbi:MAG TPA: hypothetical protein VIY51_08460, partial [Xanthobacteraceae bacterium]
AAASSPSDKPAAAAKKPVKTAQKHVPSRDNARDVAAVDAAAPAPPPPFGGFGLFGLFRDPPRVANGPFTTSWQ